MFDNEDEIEIGELMKHNALLLARLCKTLNPLINESVAFDLIYEFSMDDEFSTVEDAEKLGTYINLSTNVPDSKSTH